MTGGDFKQPLNFYKCDATARAQCCTKIQSFLLVGEPGIEPGLSAPKADVLPVYYSPERRKDLIPNLAIMSGMEAITLPSSACQKKINHDKTPRGVVHDKSTLNAA